MVSRIRIRSYPKLRADILGLSQVGRDNSFTLEQQLFADLRHGTGTQIIAASVAYEFAQEGGGVSNGVFTAAVLEALRGAADMKKRESSRFLNFANM